jgi:cytochrome-b5 reductase
MVQILRSAIFHKRDDIPIKMLYAAATPDQLAFLPTLKRKAEVHKNFEMFNTVDKVPEGMMWDGVRQFFRCSGALCVIMGHCISCSMWGL